MAGVVAPVGGCRTYAAKKPDALATTLLNMLGGSDAGSQVTLVNAVAALGDRQLAAELLGLAVA